MEFADAEDFWNQCWEWSQHTFGSFEHRGPTGPILHLKKEVNKELTNDQNIVIVSGVELLEELADCRFLVEDAVKRAGFRYEDYLAMCWMKLDKNRRRSWPRPDPKNDGLTPIEHDRSEDK